MLVNRHTEILPVLGWDAWLLESGVAVKYSSTQPGVTWSTLPRSGMLILVLWHEFHLPGLQKKTIVVGQDYYVFTPDVVGSTDDYSEVEGLDYIMGVWTTDALFNTLYRQVFEQHQQ
jgi:hypothetical protein